MRYFVWSIFEAGSGFAFCESLDGLSEKQYNQLVLGKKLNPVPDKLSIAKVSDGIIGDSIGTIWGLHIVSEDLMQILPPDEIQFVPIWGGIEMKKKYFLANVLVLANMDLGRSEVEMSKIFPEEVEKIKKLVLTEFKGMAPAVFRLKEVPSCIIVDKKLRLNIDSVTENGGQFVKIEDYNIG